MEPSKNTPVKAMAAEVSNNREDLTKDEHAPLRSGLGGRFPRAACGFAGSTGLARGYYIIFCSYAAQE
jgi:hypothetical protein